MCGLCLFPFEFFGSAPVCLGYAYIYRTEIYTVLWNIYRTMTGIRTGIPYAGLGPSRALATDPCRTESGPGFSTRQTGTVAGYHVTCDRLDVALGRLFDQSLDWLDDDWLN